MEILVTGGAGYIGSHTVVELVNSGFSPIIVDNLCNSNLGALEGIKNILGIDVPFYQIDCTDEKAMNEVFLKHNIKGAIHFAAHKAVGESVENPLKYYKNNLDSLIILLEIMNSHKIENLVFSSSCTVYGEAEIIPVTEKTPRKRSESPYGTTKNMCEDILEDCIKAMLPYKIISLRYFNPVGAHPTAEIGELPNGVPSNLVPFITQTAIGKREKLTVFGNDYDTPDGTNIRDFIHVVDLAKAHVAALNLLNKQNSPYYEAFNIGSGTGHSVLEAILAFEKVNSVKLNYEIGARRNGDVIKIYGNTQKAKKIMNWQTEKSLDEALKDAWNWELKLKSKNI